MNIVFPSRILIPIFHSFLPVFLQNLQWVLCYYNLLWGNWCVSLLFLFLPIPSLGVFGYQDWLLSLALSSLLSQKPQLEKVRKEGGEGGSWGNGGWLILENIFSGFPVDYLGSLSSFIPHLYACPLRPGHLASVTWPNLFILALGTLPLFIPYTSVLYIFRPLIFVVS